MKTLAYLLYNRNCFILVKIKPRLHSETCGYVHGGYIRNQLTSAVVWPIKLLSHVNKQQPSNN